MLNKKIGKLVAVSVLMVSAIAGSISAGAVAKTRVVQIKEGECYTLPKKSCNITIKNKKVIKLLKGRKLKAVKKGKCKVTYKKAGKKYMINVNVSKLIAPAATKEPAATPEAVVIQTPVQSIQVSGNNPTTTPTPDSTPKPTPWGPDSITYCIYNLVINRMESQSDNNTVKVYLDSLGDGYRIGNASINYPVDTGRVICTVYNNNADQFKTGDYVSLYIGDEKINRVDIDKSNDITVINGISALCASKAPVKE